MLPESSYAEPSQLDEGSSKGDEADKDDKADKEEPKEKKPVTVPAGTSMMIRTGEKVTSDDKAGRRFSATLQADLLSGGVVVAKSGSQVYGKVVESKEIGRGIVAQHSDLKLTLTDINIEGTMYPIITGSFSEETNSAILRKKSVVIPEGSILEFTLKQPLTVKK
jgi:hypothetical protein